jgi:hypothetical protein
MGQDYSSLGKKSIPRQENYCEGSRNRNTEYLYTVADMTCFDRSTFARYTDGVSYVDIDVDVSKSRTKDHETRQRQLSEVGTLRHHMKINEQNEKKTRTKTWQPDTAATCT